MIYLKNGDMFQSPCDALVNPVNCVGVSGRGLALEFRNRFPENYKAYVEACNSHLLKINIPHIFQTNKEPFRYIINFATKNHWRDKSSRQLICDGLKYLGENIPDDCISIAIPALGCGLGELRWQDVKDDYISILEQFTIDVHLYEPH